MKATWINLYYITRWGPSFFTQFNNCWRVIFWRGGYSCCSCCWVIHLCRGNCCFWCCCCGIRCCCWIAVDVAVAPSAAVAVTVTGGCNIVCFIFSSSVVTTWAMIAIRSLSSIFLSKAVMPWSIPLSYIFERFAALFGVVVVVVFDLFFLLWPTILFAAVFLVLVVVVILVLLANEFSTSIQERSERIQYESAAKREEVTSCHIVVVVSTDSSPTLKQVGAN